LLPGSAGNRILIEHLNLIADHLGNLRAEDGRSIPVIFRPWHDPNAGHYWWTTSRCTPAEYIQLYQFTVTYLRDVRRVRNFLYAFSPSMDGASLRDYLECYPCDAYVDVLGLDAYGDTGAEHEKRLLDHLRQLVLLAEAKAKVPALTTLGFKKSDRECGLKYCTTPSWLTEHVLRPIKSDAIARRISYMVFWRNEAYRPTNYYLPHPGSAQEEDLVTAAADPYVVLGDRLDGIYAPELGVVGAEARN
jgi:mannan endo-1,4-beta-mannosidase